MESVKEEKYIDRLNDALKKLKTFNTLITSIGELGQGKFSTVQIIEGRKKGR